MKVNSRNPLIASKGYPSRNELTSMLNGSFENVSGFGLNLGGGEERSLVRLNLINNAKIQVIKDGVNTSGLNQVDFTNNTVGKIKSEYLQDFGEIANIPGAKSFVYMLPSGHGCQGGKTDDQDIINHLKRSKADLFINIEQLKQSIIKLRPTRPQSNQRSAFGHIRAPAGEQASNIHNSLLKIYKGASQHPQTNKNLSMNRPNSNPRYSSSIYRLQSSGKTDQVFSVPPRSIKAQNQDSSEFQSSIHSRYRIVSHFDNQSNFQNFTNNFKYVNIQIEKEKYPKVTNKKKTLVFDFDETLAKVSMNKNNIPEHAETVDILTKNSVQSIYIVLRPGLKEILRELREHFEIVMFTSSSRVYCQGILRAVIETEGEEFFDYRLFKDSLIQRPGRNYYIKNLDILLKNR
eukprot:403367647